MITVNDTRLVQRLERPYGELEAPFAKSGPFRQSVRETLQNVFSFDYMGSSEFEGGAVSSSLDVMIAQKGKLSANVVGITLTATEMEKENAQRSVRRAQDNFSGDYTAEDVVAAQSALKWVQQTQTVPVYILAPPQLAEYARKFVTEEAQHPHHLQEPTRFRESLLNPSASVVGWFDLNNGFMFFTNKKMFEDTATIFGVKSLPPALRVHTAAANTLRLQEPLRAGAVGADAVPVAP